MKINKIISFILTIIILLFSFCPLAFALENDNLIDPVLKNWLIECDDSSSSARFEVVDSPVGAGFYRIILDFNTLYAFGVVSDITDLVSNRDYNISFKFKEYNSFLNSDYSVMANILICYSNKSPLDSLLGDHEDIDIINIVEFSNYSYGDFVEINQNINIKTENKPHKIYFAFTFISLKDNSTLTFVDIKDLQLTEVESQEGNILKRIYNFIINLPATFQNFFTDLKNGISGFFTDLKTNLSTWFDNLKNSIGDFFSNLSDNLSEFFTKLKNWLLWFNAEGSSFYTNPFEQIDDDVDDDLESNIVKLANYINDNTQSVSDSLASVGSVFLVFDTFVVGIPLVLSLIIFAFFIHILKRLLGF